MPSNPVFTPAQEKVLALLSDGYTAAAAADAAGVPRYVVGNWLCSPVFQQAVARIDRRRDLLRYRQLAPLAVETIGRIMADPGTPPRYPSESRDLRPQGRRVPATGASARPPAQPRPVRLRRKCSGGEPALSR